MLRFVLALSRDPNKTRFRKHLLICSGLISVSCSMTEMTTPEVFIPNIVFVNKHSSYKNEFFQICKKLLNFSDAVLKVVVE